MTERWEMEMTTEYELGQKLLADGWEPFAVTETFRSWENVRKGYTESETTTTLYFRRRIMIEVIPR